MKKYKVVPLSPLIIREKSVERSADLYVEDLLNEYAKEGWSYHSMETMTQADKKGCLGQVDPNSKVTYYVAIFEKDINE